MAESSSSICYMEDAPQTFKKMFLHLAVQGLSCHTWDLCSSIFTVTWGLFSCYCSVPQSCLTLTPWTAASQTSLSFTISQSLLKLMSFELVMPSNHLILHRPLLLLPSTFPNIKVFSNESTLHIRWPKYWSFSFDISPSSEYSGLISFRIYWFDLLAVQGMLKTLLQYHSPKASKLSLLHSPTLTSIHDYWENHSFDSTDLCQ